MSLLTRGHLAPGLIASGVIAWSFVPLAEIAGLLVVLRAGNRTVPFPRAVDLFFAGHAPWLLWMVAFSMFWASVSSVQPRAVIWIWEFSMVLIAIWSGYIDFYFFREVAGARKPGLLLFVQRAVSWALFFVIVGGGALWPGLLEQLRIG
jgi:hypothetical protein